MLGKLLERLGSQYFDAISLVDKDLSFYCEAIEHQSIASNISTWVERSPAYYS